MRFFLGFWLRQIQVLGRFSCCPYCCLGTFLDLQPVHQFFLSLFPSYILHQVLSYRILLLFQHLNSASKHFVGDVCSSLFLTLNCFSSAFPSCHVRGFLLRRVYRKASGDKQLRARLVKWLETQEVFFL